LLLITFLEQTMANNTTHTAPEFLLKGVLESSISGIMAFRSVRDPAGEIIDLEWILVNNKAVELAGIKKNELIGKRLLQLLPGSKTESLFDKYVKVVESGETLGHEQFCNHENLSKIWFHAIVVKCEDGFVVTFQDITNKQPTEEKYRLLAENMLDLVALHAPDGSYNHISPSVYQLLGYKPVELIDQSPYPLPHPEDIQRVREDAHNPAEAGEEISNMEYQIRKKEGAYIWFSTNTKPIKER
jgi:PAS domain S-box-containing protein